MTDMTKIKSRLAALLSRARDAGSSDAEIAACMERAEKIMADYGVTEADLADLGADDYRTYTFTLPEGMTRHCPVVRYVGPVVFRFTGCVGYIGKTDNKGQPIEIELFGIDSDVEYAAWLLASLRSFMDDQWRDYKRYQLGACNRTELTAERIGFVQGFCKTAADRIRAMTTRDGGGAGTGTALVVQKRDLSMAQLKANGVDLSGSKHNLTGTGRGSHTGAMAGAQAGNAANIGRGVGQNRMAIGSA
jgi:hypothetical protein